MTEPPLRFWDFELDPAQFELRRAGHRVRLERKPLELLILLVEKRGELVSREEIIERVWGKDFFFDAERGINNAIRKIRSALNDDSEEPHYVETVVGKGYRSRLSGLGYADATRRVRNVTKVPNQGGGDCPILYTLPVIHRPSTKNRPEITMVARNFWTASNSRHPGTSDTSGNGTP